MIDRLLSQQSHMNQIEMNKRDRMQTKLLLSLSRKDTVPLAFYDPNRKASLLRRPDSNRSTLSSARSATRKHIRSKSSRRE